MSADVEDMYRSAAAEDIHALGLASTRFHRHLVDASENLLLKRAWEALQIDARTAIALVVLSPEPRHVAKEHEELLDALKAGDVEAACLHARAISGPTPICRTTCTARSGRSPSPAKAPRTADSQFTTGRCGDPVDEARRSAGVRRECRRGA